MISESRIKAAIRKVTSGERSCIDLRDDGARGSGRLLFRVRRARDRIISEFYAIYFREGKRVTAKVALYHAEGYNGGMTLADARKRFREMFQPAISAGAMPDVVASRRQARQKHGTVRELFQAYVDRLKVDGKRSSEAVDLALLTSSNNAADYLGPDREAAAITPGDVSAYLATIYSRGKAVMALQARAYLSAAFSFAAKGEYDYRRPSGCTTWGITTNPVSAVTFDDAAKRARERFLSPMELRTFWLWLLGFEERSALAPALCLIAATGQRVEEILRVSTTAYERQQGLLHFDRTKNGLPHTVPLPDQAVAILDRLPVHTSGLYFPKRVEPTVPAPYDSLGFIVNRFLKDHPEISRFVPRDLRRTWKTLAGAAGISKEMRDRLQNHLHRDISAIHYDKYSYLAEKRAAMAKWAAYLELVLSGQITEIGQRAGNVVSIAAAR